MKKQSSMKLLVVTLSLAVQVAAASDVTGLTSFTAGTPARAADVNGNFSAVKTAVDDNQAQITTLEGVNAETRLSTLETTATGGNIVLAPSTATTGNIMKGTFPLLHNFGSNNTFLGVFAGNFTMTGIDNTASGVNAFSSNTAGNSNTASGVSALFGNTSGSNNTASGAFALESISGNSGNSNTASGAFAIRSNTTGSNNTAIGVGALSNNTTGSSNIAVGLNAGLSITTGTSNIAIGSGGGAESNTIRLGNSVDHTRAFIAGIRGITTATAAIPVLIGTDGQLGTASSSRRVKDDIADMGEASSTLMKLRPVTFHYKADQNPKGRALQYGLIAEEVETVAPDLVARSANGEIETVYYQHLTPMLLNEYQKQQRLIETQTALLAKQTARIAQLEKQGQEIVALKRQLERVTVALSHLKQPEIVASAGR